MARQKSEEKYDAIMEATLELANAEGFHGISMAKIAKAAGVAPASIYTYFENKEAILNQLYQDLKEVVARDLLKGLKPYMETKQGFALIWRNLYDSIIHYGREYAFLEQFSNSPYITQLSKEEGMRQFKPMTDFFTRAMGKGDVRNMPVDLVLSFIYPPAYALAKPVLKGHKEWGEKALGQAIDAAWHAIKA